MPKKILIVDDSALMRRVLCDIINEDQRFQVVAVASNGLEALELLKENQYDAVVLDVNMPKMNGIQVLQELKKNRIPAKVMMASTDTLEGAQVTLDALELGALDFIQKPGSAFGCKVDDFKGEFLNTLYAVANGNAPVFEQEEKKHQNIRTTAVITEAIKKSAARVPGNKIVAIASSTGGPKALQSVIPRLPADLDAPILIVQHMPKGFTASLAERLNELSAIGVKEAREGEELHKGMVYVAMGGMHMNVKSMGGRCTIHYSDEPSREGVKPSANYMYESLAGSCYDKVICVVMTGMGADGTEGIKNLKAGKHVHVISQSEESCTVYGMPKAIVNSGLADQVVPLEQIAQEIIMNVGING
ncbi:MAG: chemotaxis response regulator protein-glutamate methylesterase [Acetatifactor sp.]